MYKLLGSLQSRGGAESEYGIWQRTNLGFLQYIYFIQIFPKLFIFGEREMSITGELSIMSAVCALPAGRSTA